ncbi:MAG: hypothetical protein ACRCWF_08550 [Beijerinckiaceae bacterium]
MHMHLNIIKKFIFFTSLFLVLCAFAPKILFAQSVKYKDGIFHIEIPRKFHSVLIKSTENVKSRGLNPAQYDVSLRIRGKNISVIYAYLSSDSGLRIDSGHRGCNSKGRGPCLFFMYDIETEELVK